MTVNENAGPEYPNRILSPEVKRTAAFCIRQSFTQVPCKKCKLLTIFWTCYIKVFQLPGLYLNLEEQMNSPSQRIPQVHAENRETHSKLKQIQCIVGIKFKFNYQTHLDANVATFSSNCSDLWG